MGRLLIPAVSLMSLALVTSDGAGATKQALLQAMEGHILGESELLGTYRR